MRWSWAAEFRALPPVRRGVNVDLIEIKDKLGDEGGIGLSIMGNASKALATIGAAQACVEAGMPADVFTVRAPSGEVVAIPPWPPLGKSDWPGQIGISRADFHRILTDAAMVEVSRNVAEEPS